MNLPKRNFRNAFTLAASLILAGLSCADIAWSQPNNAGCTLEQAGGTSRMVLRCRDALTFIAEGGAQYTLVDRDRDGSVDTVRLQNKALLLDTPADRSGPGFQVVTPLAIAAVRGTKWAVDVAAGKTSVFVVRGSVAVQRPAAGSGVLLGPGEGVDVDSGGGPLTVRRWPRPRVSALLARFGQ